MDEAFWRDRPVLVTGCTGFLGPWLTKLLVRSGAKVVGLVRDGVADSSFRLSGLDACIDVVRGSVEDYPTIERAINEYEVDVVFHLAAQAIAGTAMRSPLSTFTTNVLGTAHVLEAVRTTGCARRVVIASSDKAYGNQDDLPYTEDHPLRGRYPYDVSKTCTDLIAGSYWHSYFKSAQRPVALAVARCANLFGGGDFNWSRVVPRQVRNVIRGDDLLYNRCVRHFLYVVDAAEAYLLLAERLDADGVAGEAFNFGADDGALSMEELVAGAIAETARRRGHGEARTRQLLYPPDYPARPARAVSPGEAIEGYLEHPPGEIVAQYLSCEKARRRLGWAPLHSLRDGLEDAFAWYEAWFAGRDMAKVTDGMLDRRPAREARPARWHAAA